MTASRLLAPPKKLTLTAVPLAVQANVHVAETSAPSTLNAKARTTTDVPSPPNTAEAEHPGEIAWLHTLTRSTVPAVTVNVALPLTPPADAVTVAEPTVVATICPTSETDTTFGFELAHVIVGFASGPVVVATR